MWNGRNHGTPPDEATSTMVRSSSPHGVLSHAQAVVVCEVEKKRPSHGTKRRWRDLVAVDMKKTEMTDGRYDQAQDRCAWKALCQDGVLSLVEQSHPGWHPGVSSCHTIDLYSCLCGRSFRRKGDLNRYRCFCSNNIIDTIVP